MKDNKVILAKYDDETITVYQAYNDIIAKEAVRLGKFGAHFKMERMTWIKPSFLWMMYRAGWATKEGQERILAIKIKREGFEKILEKVVLSKYNKDLYTSEDEWKLQLKKSNVRCQWDPDRDIYGEPLDRRAIQIGLKGDMVYQYVNDWIVNIEDITDKVEIMRKLKLEDRFDYEMLPKENKYPLNDNLKRILGIIDIK